MTTPVAWAVAMLLAGHAHAQPAAPTVLEAEVIRGQPDIETVAEGKVVLQRGDLTLHADRLSYRQPDDLARAAGRVRLQRGGDRYSGTELQLKLERFEGFFLEPTYYFSRMQAGGRAQRIDFLGEQRVSAIGATYTSCPADGSQDPAWMLSTDKLRLDFDKNEGIAEGAVLRFYGVPILGAPVLSFPLTDERKSGWLPPSISLDSKTGLQVAVPYYWNIAPNRDATLTPTIITRRGLGFDSEFRYLGPHDEGLLRLNALPHDKLYGQARGTFNAALEGRPWQGANYGVHAVRVSDEEHWKDFPGVAASLTPRLLPVDLRASQTLVGEHLGEWTTYARVHRWQVLQDTTNRFDAPYDRAPQLGLRTQRALPGGLALAFETEVNQFTNPVGYLRPPNPAEADRPVGSRWHALASISRPWVTPGWSLVPRVSLNAARYSIEQPSLGGPPVRSEAQRAIPTFSLDSAWVLERDSLWFGRTMRQTLESRLLYVRTPFREQSTLPNFDSAGKDFNFESLFTDNAYSGIDRVSDAHQLTAGVTSRLLDTGSGAEALRVGIAQRLLFRDQRLSPDSPNAPITQRWSDLLLLGSSSVIPQWRFDGALQYSPEAERTTRAIFGARWSPGPYRTLNAVYRLKRNESEQLELGWQWPVFGPAGGRTRRGFGESTGNSNGDCQGTWYSVGRINYSLRDSRITDSVLGAEYDAGCWIGRVVAKRLSTSQADATTQLGFEIEFVGLSRLGTNPLKVLKDNVPGYRLLRDDPSPPSPTPTGP